MAPVVLTVAPDLQSIVTAGVLAFDDVKVVERDPRLDAPLADAEAAVRRRPPEAGTLVRTMYKRTGLDPTRRRPSSEALLRRVLKGDPLPRINNVVDVCNWCSLEFQVPYGLYDLGQIQGAVVLRAGTAGESYAGIRKDDVHLEGRLVLADDVGPFGNPTSDSARTMVTEQARSILTVIFAPASVPVAALQAMLESTSARMRQFAGGVERSRGVT